MKKVIVTGANGFVGAALCKELVNNGIKVYAIVKNQEADVSALEGLKGLEMVYCDLSDFINLDRYIANCEIDALYHMAWIGSAGSLRGDYETQLRNVKYTCDTLQACHKLGCSKFIFASSIMEYEIAKSMETEDAPGINSLYSEAKVTANYMARTLAASLGITYIRGVISNIYGPGEYSPRLINTSLRKMINGEHCSFSAGLQTYDFIYITDAAKIFVALGEQGISNRTYYIGSLNPKPLKDFLCEMRNQVDPTIEIGLGEIPFHGVSLNYDEFDIYAVKNDTGFVPLIDFSEGIQKTLQWIRDN